MWISTLLLGLSLAVQDASPQEAAFTSPTANPDQAKELGLVQWKRRLEPALAASAKDSKPVLLLFQEVPG